MVLDIEVLTTLVMSEGYRLVLSVISIAVIYLVYKSIMRMVKNKGEKLELEPHIINILRLTVRVVAIIVASTVIMSIFNISSDLLIGASALMGAALGFGSSQTINNVVAGFYVLVTQPFRVKDYVKIGNLEGQVEEIAINYTSLYTPTFNLLKVPNTYVLSSKILNLTHEGVIKYTFAISFDHQFPETKLTNEVIQPAINEFCEKHTDMNLRPPESYLEPMTRTEKKYLIRLFIPRGKAKLLYTLQPELNKLIMKHYDKLKSSQ